MTDNESKNPDEADKNLTKRKKAFFILGTVFVLIAVLWFFYWLIIYQFEEHTDDAYVTGNVVQLMPQIKGTVIQINTDDTELVKEGDLLIKLDPTDYVLALEAAKAALANTVRTVRGYYEQAIEARQTVILNQANLTKAKTDWLRRANLSGNRSVSKEEILSYKTTLEGAEANYQVSLHQMEAQLALVANTDLYHHPMIQRALANFKKAYLNHQRTVIRAPITGYIAKRNIHPGQQVNTDTTMLAIIPLNDIWVDANFKENELQHIRVNQPVILTADAYPKFRYHGRVVGFNAGTGSVFSLLPPQNATGNWIKILQRLAVRISLDREELKKNPLQLGLSMRVTVDTHHREGNRMIQQPSTKYHYETTVFQQQMAEADSIVNAILKSNSSNISLPNMDSK